MGGHCCGYAPVTQAARAVLDPLASVAIFMPRHGQKSLRVLARALVKGLQELALVVVRGSVLLVSRSCCSGAHPAVGVTVRLPVWSAVKEFVLEVIWFVCVCVCDCVSRGRSTDSSLWPGLCIPFFCAAKTDLPARLHFPLSS